MNKKKSGTKTQIESARSPVWMLGPRPVSEGVEYPILCSPSRRMKEWAQRLVDQACRLWILAEELEDRKEESSG